MEKDTNKIIRRMNTAILNNFIKLLEQVSYVGLHPDEIEVFSLLKLQTKEELKRRGTIHNVSKINL